MAGNATTQVSTTYKVIYNFIGFLSPLAQACDLSLGTSCSPLSNSGVAKLGSAIPVKFKITDSSGTPFIASSLAALFTLQAVPNSTLGPPSGSPVLTFCGAGGCTGSSTERFDTTNNQYIVNADTSALAAGCYDIVLSLNDAKVYWTFICLQP